VSARESLRSRKTLVPGWPAVILCSPAFSSVALPLLDCLGFKAGRAPASVVSSLRLIQEMDDAWDRAAGEHGG
jgi:hypothetical protein